MRSAALLGLPVLALAQTAQAEGREPKPSDTKTGRAAAATSRAIFSRDLIDSDRDVRGTARCVTDRVGTRVHMLLDTLPGSEDEDKILSNMSSRMTWCIPPSAHSGWRAPTPILRGAFAEELYTREFSFRAPAKPIADYSSAKSPAKPSAAVASAMAIRAATDCTVAADPAGVDRVVRLPSGSLEANAALNAVIPRFGACLDQGTKTTASRQMLRALLAESLYHYARATAMPPASTALARKD